VNCALIISVYKDVAALKAVLNSVATQSWKDFDVIISQDGDSDCFDELLKSYEGKLRIQHFQQEDNGFLKNQLLNKVVRTIEAEKLVFIDGDCLLHPRFMENYNKSIQAGRICMGRRVDLDATTTQLIKSEQQAYPGFGQMIKNKTKRVEEAFYLPFLGQSFLKTPKCLGCNMGWSKSDLVALNGFDEDYTYPGYGEDSDIEFRGKRAGLAVFSMRYKSIQFHLDHARPNRENEVSNSQLLFEERKKREDVRCKNGLEKLAN